MNAEMGGKSLNVFAVLDDELRELIKLIIVKLSFAEEVNLCFWKSEYFAEFPHGSAVLKGVVGAKQRSIWIAFEDIAGDIVAVLP